MTFAQNAVRPGLRSYVPPEMVDVDFWLMIYQTTEFTIETPKFLFEVEYIVFICNVIPYKIIRISYNTKLYSYTPRLQINADTIHGSAV